MQMITSGIKKWTCEGTNLLNYSAKLSKICKQNCRISWSVLDNQVEEFIYIRILEG